MQPLVKVSVPVTVVPDWAKAPVATELPTNPSEFTKNLQLPARDVDGLPPPQLVARIASANSGVIPAFISEQCFFVAGW